MPEAKEQAPKEVQHRCVTLRHRSSSSRFILTLPSTQYKLLCGGIILYGRTVVLASYPSTAKEQGIEVTEEEGNVEVWVVDHVPTAATATVEIVVTAIWDPEGWVETRRSSTSLADIPAAARELLTAEHPLFQNVAIVTVSCEGPSGSSEDGATAGEAVVAGRRNPFVVTGGGFVSLTPPIDAGPINAGSGWRVTAEPHDELTAVSIAARMSASFFEHNPTAASLDDDAVLRGLRDTMDGTCHRRSGSLSCSSSDSIQFDVVGGSHTDDIDSVQFELLSEHSAAATEQQRCGDEILLPKILQDYIRSIPPAASAWISCTFGTGQWKIQLPSPFGVMCVSYGASREQDLHALHALMQASLQAQAVTAAEEEERQAGRKRMSSSSWAKKDNWNEDGATSLPVTRPVLRKSYFAEPQVIASRRLPAKTFVDCTELHADTTVGNERKAGGRDPTTTSIRAAGTPNRATTPTTPRRWK